MAGTIVTMRRRALLVSLTTAVAGAVAGCATGEATPDPTPNADPTAAPSATAIFASTTSSTLTPRTPVPHVPKAGAAPPQAFAVGRRSYSFARGADRPLPVRVWHPVAGEPGGDPTDNATPAAGRFPLVLFSHGLTAQPDDFAAMLSRWAQAGFVVAAPIYPHTSYGAADYQPLDVANQPADASYVLTQLLALAATDPLAGHIDADRIGAAGHSGGGITTAGLFSKARDKRLTAGIIMSGTDFAGSPFAGPSSALLFVHGTKDKTVAYAAGHTVFEAAPWSRAMLTITDGGHVSTGPEFEPTTGVSTDFLRWSLYGDAAAKARIPAKAAVNGVATLEDQL
jgi:dienelactone hydrolase